MRILAVNVSEHANIQEISAKSEIIFHLVLRLAKK
jgi:hypothetical protein